MAQHEVLSPLPGIFYRRPAPEKPPYKDNGDKVADGEGGYLPVLARRVLVTESLPLPLRGKGTKQWDFARLRDSGKSDTLRSKTKSAG